MIERTDDVAEHIMINYNGGDTCEGDKPYQLQMEIFCGSSIWDVDTVKVDESDSCNPKIKFSSSAGCRKASLNALWSWM